MTHGFRPKKALLKRVKVTAKGKILRRPTGINHFTAKDPGKKIREKRNEIPLANSDKKVAKKLLPV